MRILLWHTTPCNREKYRESETSFLANILLFNLVPKKAVRSNLPKDTLLSSHINNEFPVWVSALV